MVSHFDDERDCDVLCGSGRGDAVYGVVCVAVCDAVSDVLCGVVCDMCDMLCL